MNDLKRDLRKQGNDADAEYIGEVVKAVEEMQEVTGSVSKNKDIAEILAKKGAKDAKTYGLL